VNTKADPSLPDPFVCPRSIAPPAAGLPLLDELLPAPTQRSEADRGHLSTCAVHPFEPARSAQSRPMKGLVPPLCMSRVRDRNKLHRAGGLADLSWVSPRTHEG
jgi:hypothetical protein